MHRTRVYRWLVPSKPLWHSNFSSSVAQGQKTDNQKDEHAHTHKHTHSNPLLVFLWGRSTDVLVYSQHVVKQQTSCIAFVNHLKTNFLLFAMITVYVTRRNPIPLRNAWTTFFSCFQACKASGEYLHCQIIYSYSLYSLFSGINGESNHNIPFVKNNIFPNVFSFIVPLQWSIPASIYHLRAWYFISYRHRSCCNEIISLLFSCCNLDIYFTYKPTETILAFMLPC